MKVKDIVDILKCQVLNEGDMEEEVKTACGSDMMSDVLAFVKDQSVLLTGLMNPQVVRTAEMMDMHCICLLYTSHNIPSFLKKVHCFPAIHTFSLIYPFLRCIFPVFPVI